MVTRVSLWICVVVMVVMTVWQTVCAKERQYFVGIVEEEWDYAPGGHDLTMFHAGKSQMNQHSVQSNYLRHSHRRIGRKYVKAMYREFTDGTFQHQKPREDWMGLLGPLLGGEEGDVLNITFKNMASHSGRNFSMHPHGLKYTKGNEGALYIDDTSGADKNDESVAPGQQFTYRWEVDSEVVPTLDDPECMTWTYHSHVNTVRDVNSGLVGILLTCKPGMLENVRETYAKQFAMVVNVFDENESWYLDYNIHKYLLHQASSHNAQQLKQNEDFKESNMFHGFNGLVFGHLRLDVCVGSRTLWHLIGFGNEIDIHSMSVSGHSFLINQRRVDAVGLNPVDFVTAELTAQTAGQWRIQCSVLDHTKKGMVAFLNVSDCGHLNSSTSELNVQSFKRYYIAIDELDWDYAPSGRNLFDDSDLLQSGSFSEQYFSQGPTRVGGVYRKAVYRQYEDITFSTPTPRGEEEEHLGFLGPVLRVEVGDMVALTLKNNASAQAFSIHPHGASFVKMWEGALYNDGTPTRDHTDDFVQPGQVKTTYWSFPEAMGPGPMDPPCITRMYTSSSIDLVRDAYTGLIGPIVVCRKGALDSHGRQRQVDREFFLLFSVTDENLSWYSDHNMASLTVDKADEDFQRSNLMHSINGYLYGNLPGLTMCQDDRVSWHVLSVGSERDVHTAYFHGQPLTYLDTRSSSAHVQPGYFSTLLMKAQNPGQWALVDQTSEHYNAGEKALFHVNQCGLQREHNHPNTQGKNRTFFLQAEEELWDYAPSGMNWISGGNLTDPDSESYIFTTNEGPYIGKTYKKVRYHQYTDATFTTEIPRPDSEQYLGVLGPIIIAETYDVITVVFRNNASRPYSVHAQGLFYTKQLEGSPYAGSAGQVAPGQTVVYEWSVPLDFAPAAGDPACITQAYYSAVDPVKDTNSGLLGPLIVCKPGTVDNASGQRRDVDQAMVLLFKIFDENESWYLQDNINIFGTNQSLQDPDFGESNLMHAINGYVYGNNPPMEVIQHSGVAWHLMTLGNEVDLHSAHWHGNQVLLYRTGHHVADIVQLFPGVFETVWMNATRVGKWLLHCHVHDHLTAGMETVYVVKPPSPATTTTWDPFGDDPVPN